MRKLENRITFLRKDTYQYGTAEYKGIPVVDKDLLAQVDWKLIHYIDKKVKETVAIKKQIVRLENQLYYKEMSKECLGLPYLVEFADWDRKVIIWVRDISIQDIEQMDQYDPDLNFMTENPELIKNNFELLRKKDHYVVFDGRVRIKNRFAEIIDKKETIQPDAPIYLPY